MEMTSQRWANTTRYLHEVFGRVEGKDGDRQLATLMERAVKAGLPNIAVSSEVGRLLKVLTVLATSSREATGRVLEVGTLAGYSGIWIARGLPYAGRLFTIEADDTHEAFARREFADAGVSRLVEVVPGRALDVLPRLQAEFGPGGLDMVFLDADKREYPEYLRLVKPALRRGGLLVADNALGSGSWWIDEAAGEGREARDAVDRFNRSVASDPDFEASCVPMREGILIGVRVR